MSDETHDQNQSTETPDTAPSFVRVIGLAIVAYLVVACMTYIFFYGFSPDVAAILDDDNEVNLEAAATLSSQGNGAFPQSAYLRSSSSSELIDPQVQLANLAAIADMTELATLLGTYPEIDIVLVDQQMLSTTDPAFLRNRFDNGDVIVGLRISHVEMSQFLELEPVVEELTDDQKIDGVIWASVHYLDGDAPAGFTKSYDQFPTFISELHGLR